MKPYRWFLIIAVALSLIGVCVLGVVQAAKLVAKPTAAQEAALKLIETPPEFSGTNGYAALYALGRRVPEDQRQAVLETDVRRFEQHEPSHDLDRPSRWASALEDYPAISGMGDGNKCDFRSDVSCLAQVRAQSQALSSQMGQRQELLDRALELAAYDHFHSAFPIRIDGPLPNDGFSALGWVPTLAAWQFSQGDRQAGMATACKGIRIGQALSAQPDTLIASMVGGALMARSSRVLAEQMAETPVDQPLPQACDKPLSTRLSAANQVCRSLLAEGRFFILGTRQADLVGVIARENNIPRATAEMLYDQEINDAWASPQFAQFCDAQTRQEVAAGRARAQRSSARMSSSIACVASPMGCVLDDIATPTYNNYAIRIQDDVATFQAVAALAAARASRQPLNELAAGAGLGMRDVTAKDNTHLVVDLLGEHHDSLILPAPGAHLDR